MRILSYNKENAEELKALIQRESISLDEAIETVKPIITQVEKKGDSALLVLTRKLDKYSLTKENIKVTEKEIRQAY